MHNLEAIWQTLDQWAIEVAAVDKSVGMQMLTRNRELMLTYQQLAQEMTTRSTPPVPTSGSKPKETAAVKAP